MTPSSSCAPKSDERDKVETTSEGHFRSDLPTFRSPAIAAVAADTLGLAENMHSGLPSFHQSVPTSFPASTSSSSFVFLQYSTAIGLELLVLFDSFHRSLSLQLLLELLAFGSVDIVYDRLSLSASKCRGSEQPSEVKCFRLTHVLGTSCQWCTPLSPLQLQQKDPV